MTTMADELSKLSEDRLLNAVRSCVEEYRDVETLLDKLAALSYQIEKLEDMA